MMPRREALFWIGVVVLLVFFISFLLLAVADVDRRYAGKVCVDYGEIPDCVLSSGLVRVSVPVYNWSGVSYNE